jgi:hypothetical protein
MFSRELVDRPSVGGPRPFLWMPGMLCGLGDNSSIAGSPEMILLLPTLVLFSFFGFHLFAYRQLN